MKIKKSSILWMAGIMLVSAVLALIGVDASVMMADATPVAPVNAGDNVTDARTASDKLILDTIDEKVVKVRPYDVVLDTISRHAASRNSNNQIVRPYSIDALDLTTTVNTAYDAHTGAEGALGTTTQTDIDLADNDLISCDETLIAVGVPGYKEDGTTEDDMHDLILHVVGKNSNGHPIVVCLNGAKSGTTYNVIPDLDKDTVIMRAGRAGSETQIQTDAYSGYPVDDEQYLQKFLCQVEESEMFKMADKEVEWNFSDQQEEAIYDMRRTQNVTFWRGKKAKIKMKKTRVERAEDIYFTEGIWSQAGKDLLFNNSTSTELSVEQLVTLMKTAFTGNQSGKKKLFIVGSDLLESLEQVEYTRTVSVGEKLQAYGLEFNSIISKFGTLMVIHDQSLDDMGWSKRGFVLDPNFLTKWTMGWRTQNIDFKSSGQKDAEGRVFIETCGLKLKNPNAHVRVSLNTAA